MDTIEFEMLCRIMAKVNAIENTLLESSQADVYESHLAQWKKMMNEITGEVYLRMVFEKDNK